jgi:hypothetical protein
MSADRIERETWEEHGTVYGRVEAVEAPRRFAVRWAAVMDSQAIEPGNYIARKPAVR